jgi:predicted anti-sigma-YlaC factor YlaD
MKCKDFQNNILFFIDGDLDKTASARFEKHLEVCSQCKSLFEKVSGSYSLIEEAKIKESNPFFYTRVKAAIENEVKNSYRAAKKMVLQWATYSLVGLFALLTGYFIANDGNYVVKGSTQQQYKTTDEELFADSHYLTLSAEDMYIVSTEEIEGK